MKEEKPEKSHTYKTQLCANEDLLSTDLEFRKKQISIICNSLESEEVKKKDQRYQYNSLLVCKDYADKISNLLYSFCSDKDDLILKELD